MRNKEDRDKRHRKAMKRKKAHVDKRIAEATIEKNLLVVLTGNGKGKSSSAFGMLARSVGHGMRCAVVQFIKGQWKCGEQENFADHPLVDFYVMNTGFTWETQDRDKDITAAKETWDQAEKFLSDWYARLEEEYKKANSYKPSKADWFSGAWEGLDIAREKGKRRGDTSINNDKFKIVGQGLTKIPKNFNLHKKLQKIIDQRESSFEGKTPIDWSSAEALALGSLLVEGVKIRLTGQDSGRGTFSQRHAVLVDQKNDNKIILLNNIKKNQAIFEIVDSPLSEASVLGFEYGYSLAEPNALVMWEAQFGDFANGAQVIIDQFISSGESKWLRMSGLTLLLPHGYEGQGPEHSSARLERFLQLCAEDNLQIVNCTTPANYFHVLRRQMHRSFRKPVIIFTPKSLLRNKNAVSKISDFTSGSWFHRVLPDPKKSLQKDKVKRVVLCSGKVFYDLVKMREEEKLFNVRLIRVEQLYPFPEDAVVRELKNFSKAKIIWCQEEPKNMGAWTYINPLIEEVMLNVGSKQNRLQYAGREAQASTATGLFSRHQQEQQKLLTEALLEKIK